MDCIFCKIAKKIIPAKIITETKNSIAFLDAFPLVRGHTLVIPKRHYEKVQDMTYDDNMDLFGMLHKIVSSVDKITGSTLLAIHNGKKSGQEIPHVHVHIIPRYSSRSVEWTKRKIVDDVELNELAKKIRDCME